jgi:hypothetical protein
MRSQLDLRVLALTGAALLLPGVSRAQDAPPPEPPRAGQDASPPFRPSNDQLDKDLDRSLHEEYDESQPAPLPPPPPVVTHHHDDRLRLRLGGMAAFYYAQLHDAKVAFKHGGSGGQKIDLGPDGGVADFDPARTLTYRAWFDIGKHVSLAGGFRRTAFSDSAAVGQGFTFGTAAFSKGESVHSRVEMMTADLDLVVKPLNLRFIEIDLNLGSRYMYWRTELKSNSNPLRTEHSTVEAAVPVIGAGIAIRPVRPLELFARGRVGYLSYDRPKRTWHHHEVDTTDPTSKTAKTAELDVGVSLTFRQTIGLIVGYRLDYVKIEKETDSRTQSVNGTVHGVYAGLILQF